MVEMMLEKPTRSSRLTIFSALGSDSGGKTVTGLPLAGSTTILSMVTENEVREAGGVAWMGTSKGPKPGGVGWPPVTVSAVGSKPGAGEGGGGGRPPWKREKRRRNG